MKVQEVKIALKDYKNGTYIRLVYESIIPVIEDCNLQIKKVTTSNVRLGIHYGNLESVKNRDYKPKKRQSNMFNFYKNILCTNLNTKKDYLNVFMNSNIEPKIQYVVNGSLVESLDSYKDMLKSPLRESKPSEFKRISLDKIISLG